MNNFTKLVNVDGWIIERKISLEKNEVVCRASKPGYSTWYGFRVRLNEEDELVVPSGITYLDKISESTIAKVRESLVTCRKAFFYLPEY